jgi:hypothetical protein
MPSKVEDDKVFVKCLVSEKEVIKIIMDMGGYPFDTINIDNGDGTETRIFSSYKRL